jgi:hypothetical protein
MNLSQVIMDLLGDTANNYTTTQIFNAGFMARNEIETYCRRTFPGEDLCMNYIIARVAVLRLQRIGTDGLASQSYSGVSESYIDGYPADILAVLNMKRKIKVV